MLRYQKESVERALTCANCGHHPEAIHQSPPAPP
ncbi:protein NinF, partial [Salmonella sp. 741265086_PSA]